MSKINTKVLPDEAPDNHSQNYGAYTAIMSQQVDRTPYMHSVFKKSNDDQIPVPGLPGMDYQLAAPNTERHGWNASRMADDNLLNLPIGRTHVPVYHDSSNTTTFVNSKQYQPILRLRLKKLKKMKNIENARNTISKNLSVRKLKKQKVKYESRSNHAKNRKRAENGKFLPKALREKLAKEAAALEALQAGLAISTQEQPKLQYGPGRNEPDLSAILMDTGSQSNMGGPGNDLTGSHVNAKHSKLNFGLNEDGHPQITLGRVNSSMTNELFKDASIYEGPDMKLGGVDPIMADNESAIPFMRYDSLMEPKK